MIRFLKRHVWPWAEIERLRLKVEVINLKYEIAVSQCKVEAMRCDQYELPHDESCRFVRNG